VGIYNAVINVGRIPFYFFSQLAFLLLPTVSKMIAEKSKEEVRILIRSSLRYIIMLIVPTVAAIMIYAKPIIRLLYSQKYEVGSLSLEIFVLGVGALTVFFITTFILNGANKVRASAILAWTGLLINIALNLILIPKFSIVGSASATTVTSFSLMILSLYWVTRVFGSCFDYVSLLKSTAAAIIAAGIFAYLPKTIFSLFAGGAAYFIFYFIILSFLGELKTEDKENLKKIFIGSLTRKKQPQIESSD
jgi:O-antigen/teichoic acid export membrane protein